jgi:hypothetical protein
MPCASVQMAGRALGMDSSWKHARSPSDHEWRRAIDRCRSSGFGFGFKFDFDFDFD